MLDHLYQIEAPHFVAGFIVNDDKVTEAAPIIKYMIGWTVSKVDNYCSKKGWKLV